MRFLQHGTYGSKGKVVGGGGGGGQEFFFFTKTQGTANSFFLEKKIPKFPGPPLPFP